ncbi:amidase family protein [Rhizobium binxianense]
MLTENKEQAPAVSPEAVGNDGTRRVGILPPAQLRLRDAKINAFSEIFDTPTQGEGTGQDGALSGLSFAVKEVIDQAGKTASWGVSVLRDRVAPTTATVVQRLLTEGAVSVGTTRSTAFAIAGDSGSRNPCDLSRTPGGSSAGSAAAVSAGMVDFAIGTQTVGSIIRPAAYCGVVGFKPTYGKVPADGVMILSKELDHVGFMARDIETVERIFQVFAPRPDRVQPAREVVFPKLWFDTAPREYWRPLEKALLPVFSELGVASREIEFPRAVTDNERRILDGLLCRSVKDNFGDIIDRNPGDLPGELYHLAQAGASISDLAHAALVGEQMECRRIMDQALDDDGLVIMPSVLDWPPKLGSGTGLREPQRLWSLIGWPCVHLPLGFGTTEDGKTLPVGVQIVGKPGQDHKVLESAGLLAETGRGVAFQEL